jgi:hypothetical protein
MSCPVTTDRSIGSVKRVEDRRCTHVNRRKDSEVVIEYSIQIRSYHTEDKRMSRPPRQLEKAPDQEGCTDWLVWGRARHGGLGRSWRVWEIMFGLQSGSSRVKLEVVRR